MVKLFRNVTTKNFNGKSLILPPNKYLIHWLQRIELKKGGYPLYEKQKMWKKRYPWLASEISKIPTSCNIKLNSISLYYKLIE